MNEYHLIKQFSKPREGEYVPITFIEFKRKRVGWSPQSKRSVYIESDEDATDLKRIREINLMIAINHLSGKLCSIELTDEEKNLFEDVYGSFLRKGGQIVYTRKKIGAKNISIFELREEVEKKRALSKKKLLSDLF